MSLKKGALLSICQLRKGVVLEIPKGRNSALKGETMFKYLITLLFAVSSVQAEAKIDAEDIFFGINGGIILGKIIEKQNKDEDSWTNSDKLILKDTGNQLVMANLALPAHGGSDSVRFPECNKNTRNRRVDALRFRVDNADAFVS